MIVISSIIIRCKFLQTELERVYEWIKSGLRVMLAISALDGAMNSRKFADFVESIKNSNPHRPFLNAVQSER
jgi:hypothetical protein